MKFHFSHSQCRGPKKIERAPREQAAEEPGNRICSELIDSYHPSLCVVAGATRRRSIRRIAHSLVVNPGRLADGSVAWLDRNQPADHGVEFFKI